MPKDLDVCGVLLVTGEEKVGKPHRQYTSPNVLPSRKEIHRHHVSTP